ncbi:cell division protein ZapA [Alsobacter sp. SYSU M60028]|uniref:Cell division protein ZapA n=1 Tax=Alsobacter ponti TaxID=2962936 RepID=A0ABT1LGC7_9HYPH|nr:cell division protein ZapA [Alsobacter ponti]
MGQVTVTIAAKVYRIACDDGQEEHLRNLAADVDAKIEDMRKAFGEIGDNRLTVMAAITFVDERQELKGRLARLEAELSELRARTGRMADSLGEAQGEMARAIHEAADRIESVARQLAPAPHG